MGKPSELADEFNNNLETDQDFYATGNIANGFRQGISRSSDNAVILVQYNNTLTPTDGFTMYIDIKVYS